MSSRPAPIRPAATATAGFEIIGSGAALYVTCAELRALAVANNVQWTERARGDVADQEPPAETVAVATVVPALSFTVTTEPASPYRIERTHPMWGP